MFDEVIYVWVFLFLKFKKFKTHLICLKLNLYTPYKNRVMFTLLLGFWPNFFLGLMSQHVTITGRPYFLCSIGLTGKKYAYWSKIQNKTKIQKLFYCNLRRSDVCMHFHSLSF